MVEANNAAAVRFVASARTATAKPPRTSPRTSAPNRETLPRGIGRIAVRLMIASISASYHMLSTPAAPAPAAMARTAASVVSGSSRTGALLNPTSAVKTASIITRGFVSATKSDTLQWPASGRAESDGNAKRARLSPSWPAMDLTFISLLRVFQNESCRVQFRTAAVRAFNMHLHSRPRLNAAARLGQIMLKRSADWFRSSDTRRDRTIQDNSSTFQQALHASFS